MVGEYNNSKCKKNAERVGHSFEYDNRVRRFGSVVAYVHRRIRANFERTQRTPLSKPVTEKTSSVDDFPELSSRVRTRTLQNGLRVIVVSRGQAPVVSFHTYVDVGSVDERPGLTGIAHMFEHMAFKGSSRVGTSDWIAERAALAAEEQTFLAWRDAVRRESPDAETRRAEFDGAHAHALEFVASEEYSTAIERAGGVGLNATTGTDATQYFYSLPANKIELWAWLESERFADPVLREFYKERDVVQEERRSRTDSNPLGKLIEEALIAAFDDHPYGRPVIGFQRDLEHFSRTEAEEFYKTTYGPEKMVLSIVGRVDPEQTFQIVERYFSRIEKNRPNPAPPEPVARITGEKRLEVALPAQPIYVAIYRRPNGRHDDDTVYHAIADLLGGGEYSRLQKSVVKTGIAVACQAGSQFPGSKYSTGFFIFAIPVQGRGVRDVEIAVEEEMQHLIREGPREQELAGVRERAKNEFLYEIESNAGLARLLAHNEAIGGGWRETFQFISKVNGVTASRVREVATALFQKENRTVVTLKPTNDANAAAPEANS